VDSKTHSTNSVLSSETSIITGLLNILDHAKTYDVCTLILPLLMLPETGEESMITEETDGIRQRCTFMFHLLKDYLTNQNTDELKEIIFIAAKSKDLSTKFLTLAKQIFNS